MSDREETEELFDEYRNTIELIDENGNTAQFEFLDLISYEDEDYVVLASAEDDAAELVIMKVVTNDDGTEEYCTLDDEALMQTIVDIFKTKFLTEMSEFLGVSEEMLKNGEIDPEALEKLLSEEGK